MIQDSTDRVQRETLHYDVLVVGGGPAGLATAYRLKTLANHHSHPLSICVLEKSARIGGHLLSGTLMDMNDLATLVPDWQERGVPINHPVTSEFLKLLTHHHALTLPVPKQWRHGHCHMVSLGTLMRWLANLCEEDQTVDIFPGFAAMEPVWHQGGLRGVVTDDKGVDTFGKATPNFQPGVILQAPITVLAEGCRGSVSGKVIQKLNLNKNALPQKYALGLKELWHTPNSKPGTLLHTLGWPLKKNHGGGFLYRPKPNQTAVGLVVDLNYTNPFFDMYETFQIWKTHPLIRSMLNTQKKPTLLSYGGRTLTVGGWQSLPHMAFDGGILVGDSAGLLNTATLKGVGNAIHSGLLAAQTIFDAFLANDFSKHKLTPFSHTPFSHSVKKTPWGRKLYAVRNVRPGFHYGKTVGFMNAGWELVTQGKSPWSLSWHKSDRSCLKKAKQCKPYPPFVTKSGYTFLRTEALATSGLHHDENQPIHLRFKNPKTPYQHAYQLYANPETRFCPAGVFQIQKPLNKKIHWKIHASHCLHCKCCDIKDPLKNIRWMPPQGGSGPDYGDM